MSVSAKYHLLLRAEETMEFGQDLAGDPVIQHEITGVQGTLDGSSTPPATTPWSDERSLSGGSDSLDLTSLARPGGLAAVNMSGLKVQAYMVQADAGNTAEVVIAPAGIDGYNLFGDANGQIAVHPGDAVAAKLNESLPDVAAGAKDLTITSGDGDAKYRIVLVAG